MAEIKEIKKINNLSFKILQAARVRVTSTRNSPSLLLTIKHGFSNGGYLSFELACKLSSRSMEIKDYECLNYIVHLVTVG